MDLNLSITLSAICAPKFDQILNYVNKFVINYF